VKAVYIYSNEERAPPSESPEMVMGNRELLSKSGGLWLIEKNFC
jgi:hypothetical protein